MLRCVKKRRCPSAQVHRFARSAREIKLDGRFYSVKEVSHDVFKDIDIALFAGTEGEKGASLTYAPSAVKYGTVVIDNGADFRMKPYVPLVIPEVNAQDIKRHKGIISSPNCSTIQMVVAIYPIYKLVGIKRIIVTTFQAASGAGRAAVRQLTEENRVISLSKYENVHARIKHRAMPQQLAYNLFPHIGSFDRYDYTTEEWKMVKETHKIMHDKKIKISATCVRVPVRCGHSEAIYLETEKAITPEKVRDILSKEEAIAVIDEPENNLYPQPKDVEGKDKVFVGRIRKDPFIKNGLWLWVVADNLRKGAALNAVQIAECVISS
jgi:aspartate-semialdehyde dehydrogenase